MLLQRIVLLIVIATVAGVLNGCGSSKETGNLKAPAGMELSPLPPPSAPGGDATPVVTTPDTTNSGGGSQISDSAKPVDVNKAPNTTTRGGNTNTPDTTKQSGNTAVM